MDLIALFTVLVLRRVARRIVARNVDLEEGAYRANKLINYVATGIFLATVAFIWIDAFDDLPTYLGLVSAGVAIALADVLKNLAGWVYILSRRPFQVGDRVEVNEYKGDVVDIRLFRFSLMEIEGWVDAEQSTGRLVHVPNGVVFTKEVANYTEGFGYIWHELPVVITFESDWKLAERLILDILENDAPDVHGAAGATIKATAQRYSITVGTLTPTVYLSMREYGVLLTAIWSRPALGEGGKTGYGAPSSTPLRRTPQSRSPTRPFAPSSAIRSGSKRADQPRRGRRDAASCGDVRLDKGG